MAMWGFRNSPTYRSQQYCMPLSEWWTSPSGLSLPVCTTAALRAFSVKKALSGKEKRPAYYRMGITVGHQMQAAASPVRVDVGYAAYPQTVCRIRDAVLYQVFPFVVTVVGVGGMPTAGRLSEQLVTRRSFRKASRPDIRPRPNRSHSISHQCPN